MNKKRGLLFCNYFTNGYWEMLVKNRVASEGIILNNEQVGFWKYYRQTRDGGTKIHKKIYHIK